MYLLDTGYLIPSCRGCSQRNLRMPPNSIPSTRSSGMMSSTFPRFLKQMNSQKWLGLVSCAGKLAQPCTIGILNQTSHRSHLECSIVRSISALWILFLVRVQYFSLLMKTLSFLSVDVYTFSKHHSACIKMNEGKE